MTFPLGFALLAASLASPDAWRADAVKLVEGWLRAAPDPAHGGFHMNLDREWKPVAPKEKVPALISRHVYGFSAAYMLTGDERYLAVARNGANYLIEHAWDKAHSGWYDLLTENGRPLKRTKSVSLQLYTNVGLTAYYFATGDERAIERVRASVNLQRERAFDKEHGGYAQTFNEDLKVADFGKNKHAHYGYAGSLLLNLYLATGDPQVRNWSEQLMDISLERMRDRGGWLYGFRSTFDRRWRRTPFIRDDRELVSTGAQLTAALALARLHEQTGQSRYHDALLKLSERLIAAAWDAKTGAWLDSFDAREPSRAIVPNTVWWWVQIYGSFLEMHLYHLTGQKAHLDRFVKSEEFFREHFNDREFGGLYSSVNTDGTPPSDRHKASSSAWHTSYHELEHALLNYVYLHLYVQRTAPKLYVKVDSERPRRVCPADDRDVAIAGVTRDGKLTRWESPDGCTLSIPGARGETFAVTFRLKR